MNSFKLKNPKCILIVLTALSGSIVSFQSSVFSLAEAKEVRVGVVLDKGGKDDKSFNSAALRGALKAKDVLKVYVKYVEATDDNAFATLLRSFAQKEFDLIVAVGVSQVEAVRKVSAQFPDRRFAIIDGEVSSPNVRSLLFEEQEGSFIVGAIAAQVSKTGTIGFIGGMDIPIIRRFEKGYIAGAKNVNPKVKVLSNFVGMTADAWNNPARGKELAVSQYDSKADIIFGAAGASGEGIFDAAEEKKQLAIGVDSNQNFVKPGFILTSMVKRVDEAIYQVCKDVTEGKFSGGIQKFGLANQGIDYSVDSFNEKLLPLSVRKKADELKKDVIAGRIKVPDYYLNSKK